MRSVTTLAALVVALAPLPVSAQQSFGPTKQDAEVMNYRLSMDKLRKLVDVYRALNAALASDPRLFDSMNHDMEAMAGKNADQLTASQKAAIIDRRPAAKRVFTGAGWTAREWLLTNEALMNAFLSIEARSGTVEAPAPATAAQKANVALLLENDAAFKRIQEELAQATDEMPDE